MRAVDHGPTSFFESGSKLKPEASASYLTTLALYISVILEVSF